MSSGLIIALFRAEGTVCGQIKGLIYYLGYRGLIADILDFTRAVVKGLICGMCICGGSHPPDGVINLKLSDFWETAEQPRNTRLQVGSGTDEE